MISYVENPDDSTIKAVRTVMRVYAPQFFVSSQQKFGVTEPMNVFRKVTGY